MEFSFNPNFRKYYWFKPCYFFPNVDINMISIWRNSAEKCMFCSKQYLFSLSENEIELMANICST